ncbi:MAG: hypothetical protein VYC82_08490 [Verrucomicrobiota bacterium]|nr:hypothetical protein [Verrucomicrobiota bacterium]
MLRKSSISLFLSVKLVSSDLLASPLLADPYSARTVSTGDYRITVERLSKTPITSYASSNTLRTKINGPSLIRVPDWIRDPLGKYYLYFAHHDGKFIRLAYANAIQGPWSIYEPGTLRLEAKHLASFDEIGNISIRSPTTSDGRDFNLAVLSRSGACRRHEGLNCSNRRRSDLYEFSSSELHSTLCLKG